MMRMRVLMVRTRRELARKSVSLYIFPFTKSSGRINGLGLGRILVRLGNTDAIGRPHAIPRCLVFVSVDVVEGVRLSQRTCLSSASAFTLRGFDGTQPLSNCESHSSETSIQPRHFPEGAQSGALGSPQHFDDHEHCPQDRGVKEAPPFVY